MSTIEIYKKYENLKEGDIIYLKGLDGYNASKPMEAAFIKGLPVIFDSHIPTHGFSAYIQGSNNRTWYYRYDSIDRVEPQNTEDEQFLNSLY